MSKLVVSIKVGTDNFEEEAEEDLGINRRPDSIFINIKKPTVKPGSNTGDQGYLLSVQCFHFNDEELLHRVVVTEKIILKETEQYLSLFTPLLVQCNCGSLIEPQKKFMIQVNLTNLSTQKSRLHFSKPFVIRAFMHFSQRSPRERRSRSNRFQSIRRRRANSTPTAQQQNNLVGIRYRLIVASFVT